MSIDDLDLVVEKNKTIADPSVHESGFTIISNEIINNTNLSFRAKGLLIYLLSKPPKWVFRDEDLRDHIECGRNLLENAFNELRKAGYSKRVFIRKGGKLTGSTRIFSSTPKFLKKLPTLVIVQGAISDSPKSGGSGDNSLTPRIQGHLKTGLISNTDCSVLDDHNILNNNNNTQAHPVVVSFGEKEMEILVNKLVELGVGKSDSQKWISTYGENRTKEVIQLIEEKIEKITNPGAFIRKAFELGWLPSNSKKKKHPVEFMNQEEMREWAKRWWPKLSNQEKLDHFIKTKKETRNSIFRHMVRSVGVNDREILLDSFVGSTIFNFMVDLMPAIRKLPESSLN